MWNIAAGTEPQRRHVAMGKRVKGCKDVRAAPERQSAVQRSPSSASTRPAPRHTLRLVLLQRANALTPHNRRTSRLHPNSDTTSIPANAQLLHKILDHHLLPLSDPITVIITTITPACTPSQGTCKPHHHRRPLRNARNGPGQHQPSTITFLRQQQQTKRRHTTAQRPARGGGGEGRATCAARATTHSSAKQAPPLGQAWRAHWCTALPPPGARVVMRWRRIGDGPEKRHDHMHLTHTHRGVEANTATFWSSDVEVENERENCVLCQRRSPHEDNPPHHTG